MTQKKRISRADAASLLQNAAAKKANTASAASPTQLKMLQNEVSALWTAHSELLIEINKLKAAKDEQ